MEKKIKEMILDGIDNLEILQKLKCGLLLLHKVKKNLTEDERFTATKNRFARMHPFLEDSLVEELAKNDILRIDRYKAWEAWQASNKPTKK